MSFLSMLKYSPLFSLGCFPGFLPLSKIPENKIYFRAFYAAPKLARV
jgi:hypothetical protein